MQASAVEQVIAGLKAAGVSVVCYLPDSLLKELYPALDHDPDIRTIRVTNEGEGAAICGGIWLSGKKSALIMENSGLRASIEPLLKPEIEEPRLVYFLEKQMITPETKALGIGDIDDKRMTNAIATVADAYGLARKPEVKEVFDRAFLPPKAERELKMPGK